MQLYPKANKIIVTSNETKNLIAQKFKINKQNIITGKSKINFLDNKFVVKKYNFYKFILYKISLFEMVIDEKL